MTQEPKPERKEAPPSLKDVVRRMLNTPPTPHKPKAKQKVKKPAK